MRKISVFIVLIVICFTHSAYGGRWDEMVKTEKLLDSLNVLTKELIEVSENDLELLKQIASLIESNKRSSEKMESLTTHITVLTWVLVGFTIIQFVGKEQLFRVCRHILAFFQRHKGKHDSREK